MKILIYDFLFGKGLRDHTGLCYVLVKKYGRQLKRTLKELLKRHKVEYLGDEKKGPQACHFWPLTYNWDPF